MECKRGGNSVLDSEILVAGADPGFVAIKLDTGDAKILLPAVICKGNERILGEI